MVNIIKKNWGIFFTIIAIFCFAFFVNHSFQLNLPIATTHAQVNVLHAELLPPNGADGSNGTTNTAWLFSTWRIIMGLANAFVALILIFFAFVNIAHIEYDTYQIKKTLPKLIIGVILANFSMVICRMLADTASVLTSNFAHDIRGMMTGVLCAVGFGGPSTTTSMITQFSGLGILLFLGLYIGILILALVMLIRHVVILILAAVAPVAFIMLAFPPTEAYFKHWWEWYINWVFMGPIVMLLLWLAGQIGGVGACQSGMNIISATAVLALIYLAAIVPGKLGGAVMGAYTGALKTAGKKAWDNPYSNRQKKLIGSTIGRKFSQTRLGGMLARKRMAEENDITNNEGLIGAEDQRQLGEHLKKNKDKQKNIDAAIQDAKSGVENLKLEMALEVKTGHLGKVSDKFLRKIYGVHDGLFTPKAERTGQEAIRKRYLDQRQRTNDAKNATEKEDSETLLQQAGIVAEKNYKLTKGTDQMPELHSRRDNDGKELAAGAPDTTMKYTEAMNKITEFEFLAKEHAGTAEGQQYHDAADHLRNKTEEYRDNNKTYGAGVVINGNSATGEKVEYEAFKDKNLAGRQMMTMGRGMADEVKTLQQTTSYTDLVKSTNIPGKSFTNGRFSCSQDSHNKMLTGKDIGDVGITERIVSAEYARAAHENSIAASRGDRKGIEAQQLELDRVQDAHNAQGTGINWKADIRKTAATKISEPAQKHVKAEIMMQASPPGTYADSTAAAAAYDTAPAATLTAALEAFDATKVDTTSNKEGATYMKAFLDSTNTEIESENNLKFSSNPGSVVMQVK